MQADSEHFSSSRVFLQGIILVLSDLIEQPQHPIFSGSDYTPASFQLGLISEKNSITISATMEIKGLAEARLFEPDIFCPSQQRSLRGHMPPCCIYESGYHSTFKKRYVNKASCKERETLFFYYILLFMIFLAVVLLGILINAE